MISKGIFWIITFTSIMVVAVIFLFTNDEVSLSYFGLPSWLFGMLFIELIYSLTMWFFMKYYWKENKTRKQE
jgi:hypothetical protein